MISYHMISYHMILSYDMILENFRRTENREQTDREFNYRGHSYPLWIVGVSGPINKKYPVEIFQSHPLPHIFISGHI